MYEELIKPVLMHYGFPSHIKTDEQESVYIQEYVTALSSYKNIPYDAVKSEIYAMCKFKPKIIDFKKAIAKHTASKKDDSWKVRRDVDRERYNLRRKSRADIYTANQDRIDKVIANGWGMDLACCLSDCFEAAWMNGKSHRLDEYLVRKNYCPARCQGKEPIDYFSDMPVNKKGQHLRFKHPVEFIDGVMS